MSRPIDLRLDVCDLSRHPEYAKRVGELVSLWSLIELRLSVLFGSLLRCPPWTAWQAFFAIANARARIDMVTALARELDHRLPERAELIALIDKVRKAPAARHGYAHKPWIEQNGKLYQLDMPAAPMGKSVKHHVSLKHLDADCSALRAIHDELFEFQVRFGNRYLLQLEPQVSAMPEPWPGKWPLRIPRRRR